MGPAQTMASTHINPLAALSDTELSAEWRKLDQWIKSIPSDKTTHIQTLQLKKSDLEEGLAKDHQRLESELTSRRPLRHVLAGRDDRGRQARRSIAAWSPTLDKLRNQLNEAESSQSVRTRMLDTLPEKKSRLSEFSDEIDRRVSLRVELQIAEPSAYIERSLGKRPEDDERSKSWVRGIEIIERFRLERGVTDEKYALGRESDLVTNMRLNAVREEIDPPKRSKGMRRCSGPNHRPASRAAPLPSAPLTPPVAPDRGGS